MNKKQIILFGVVCVIILMFSFLIINKNSVLSQENIIEEESQKDSISENEIEEVDIGEIYSEDSELIDNETIEEETKDDLITEEDTETGIDIGELYD